MILITGAAGFIGSCLIKQLVRNYKTVSRFKLLFLIIKFI